MSANTDITQARFAAALLDCEAAASKHFYIALSGGLDSCVLLHLMAGLRQRLSGRMTVLHFDHGLQPDSEKWSAFCQQLAADYQLPFQAHRTTLVIDKQQGVEASARKARYQWFATVISDSDAVLLTAHHADDQAETLVLNMLRGTGLRGLRGIARNQDTASYTIQRPLLDWTCEQLLDYARAHRLQWVDDPSNTDRQYLRNHLRQTVMPALREARTDVAQQFVKVADHVAVASQLLRELAEQDLRSADRLAYCPLDRSHGINLTALVPLGERRVTNAISEWLAAVEYPANSRRDLMQLTDWVVSGTAAGAELRNGKRVYRFYRQCLFVMPVLERPSPSPSLCWNDPQQPLVLPDLGLRLVNRQADPVTPLTVSFRHESPLLLLPDASGHIHLRKRFQTLAIPPWRRDCAPIISQGTRLVDIVGGVLHPQEQSAAQFILQPLPTDA